MKDEILYYNDRVCVPKFGEQRLNSMNNIHDILVLYVEGRIDTFVSKN